MIKTAYTGDLDARAMKDVLVAEISKLLKEDPDVVYLDADLMGAVGIQKLMEESDRVINCGIAEANMVGVACGLSASGFKPFVHSFGTFASRRCFDQAFLSGGYAGNAITIIGSDPGVYAAFNGATHMPFEDMALYRALPKAIVMDITDPNMLIDILKQVKDIPGVKYLRMGRKSAVKIYEDGTHFEIGKGNVLKDGDDAVIVACGIMVHEAMKASAELEKSGIFVSVIDMFTIKPLDEELVKDYAAKTGVIVTAENHNRIGGLYSAVCETLSGRMSVGCVAVKDSYGEVGSQDYLQKRFGLTAEHIISEIKSLIINKVY
ncbi:MAG: transketolase family protein [Flexilinea sp.]